jgi:hypothetical protein
MPSRKGTIVPGSYRVLSLYLGVFMSSHVIHGIQKLDEILAGPETIVAEFRCKSS